MSVAKYILLANTAVTATATNQPAQPTSGKDKNFIGFIDCTSFTSGTIVGVIQHSPDKVNWFPLCTFTGITGTTKELIYPTNDMILPYVRATTSGGVGTVKIELHHD